MAQWYSSDEAQWYSSDDDKPVMELIKERAKAAEAAIPFNSSNASISALPLGVMPVVPFNSSNGSSISVLPLGVMPVVNRGKTNIWNFQRWETNQYEHCDEKILVFADPFISSEFGTSAIEFINGFEIKSSDFGVPKLLNYKKVRKPFV